MDDDVGCIVIQPLLSPQRLIIASMSSIQLKIASSDTTSEESPYGLRAFNLKTRGLVGCELTGPARPPQSPPESPRAGRARFEHWCNVPRLLFRLHTLLLRSTRNADLQTLKQLDTQPMRTQHLSCQQVMSPASV